MEIGKHFQDMMKEREIPQEWIDRCVSSPENTEVHPDGTKHYIKRIPEFENKWLRVVINQNVSPSKAVTVFFDRRLRKKYESKS
jgi:hypothetical protein